jgi:hypothetical protein
MEDTQGEEVPRQSFAGSSLIDGRSRAMDTFVDGGSIPSQWILVAGDADRKADPRDAEAHSWGTTESHRPARRFGQVVQWTWLESSCWLHRG